MSASDQYEEEELEGYEPETSSESESDGQEAFENYVDEADKVLADPEASEENSDPEDPEDVDTEDIEEKQEIQTIGGIRVPPWKEKELIRSEEPQSRAPSFVPAGPSIKLRVSPIQQEELKKSKLEVPIIPALAPLAPLEPIVSNIQLRDLTIGEAGTIANLDGLDLESLKEEDPEYYRAITGTLEIEDVLKQGKSEPDNFFGIRSAVSRKLSETKMNSSGTLIDPRTCVVLGSVIAQKVVNGVTYNDKLEKTIRFILDKIR